MKKLWQVIFLPLNLKGFESLNTNFERRFDSLGSSIFLLWYTFIFIRKMTMSHMLSMLLFRIFLDSDDVC